MGLDFSRETLLVLSSAIVGEVKRRYPSFSCSVVEYEEEINVVAAARKDELSMPELVGKTMPGYREDGSINLLAGATGIFKNDEDLRIRICRLIPYDS